MLHVLVGEDDFSIRQAVEEIKKGIGDPTALMTNTTVLNGRQVTTEQLKNACETVPFLSEKRMVIIDGLLERFETGGRTGRKKSARRDNQLQEHETIAESIKSLPEFTELIIIGGNVKAANPLLRLLSTMTQIKMFPLLKSQQLNRWIEGRVKEMGGSISSQAVSLLVRFVGNDLWIMANEVDKLILYAGERRIEEGDVRSIVSYTQESNVFAMVDALLELRTSTAQTLLQQLFRQGMAPSQLLVMISRQVRILFQVKDMRMRKKSRNEIQNALGLTSDFVFRKAWEQSDKYSLLRLRELYHRLLDTDISIKTGKLDGELALTILIAESGQKRAIETP